MELILFLILATLVIIAFQLTGILKKGRSLGQEVRSVRNNRIDEKIKISESKLHKTYLNHEEVYKKIELFELDVDYLEDDLDFNAEYFDCGVIRGELLMFKDLEAGKLDRTGFFRENPGEVENILIQIFPHVHFEKRKGVVNSILLENVA